jgi:hypothetical protein
MNVMHQIIQVFWSVLPELADEFPVCLLSQFSGLSNAVGRFAVVC